LAVEWKAEWVGVYNKIEKSELARKIDLENHVRKLVLARAIGLCPQRR